MIYLRLALCWLLGIICARFPQRPEKAAHEPTLPEELHASLQRLISRIRPVDKADTAETPSSASAEGVDGGSGSNGAAEGLPKPSLRESLHAVLSSAKEKLSFLSKLNTFPGIIASLLVLAAIVYFTLYFSFTTAPEINPEDSFRLTSGRPLVRVAYIKEWPSSEALARLVSVLITQNMNAEVMLKSFSQSELDKVFSVLAKGEIDAFPSAWMPSTHGEIVNKLEDSGYIKDMGAVVRGAVLGLAVPSYMQQKSIGDLKNVDFGRRIYGTDPGSRLNRKTKEALGIYDLPGVTVVEKTDYYSLRKLADALQKKENIVIATWEPNWIFGQYSLRMLSDPQNVFGKPEDIHLVVSREFADNLPRINECLGLVKLNIRELSSLMARMHENPERAKVAAEWLQENRLRVRAWLEPMLN